MRALLGSHEMRREVRREVSERVTLAGDTGGYEGWTLNVSRGGVRLIVETEVALGDEFDVIVGALDASPLTRRGRVVWLQEETDGFIVGVAFINNSAHEQQ
jgi:hypothetical protein